MSQRFMASWRFLNLFFLLALWLYMDGETKSFLFIVLLAVLVCLRFRFALPNWTAIIDVGLCFWFLPFWAGAVYGLTLPLFESVRTKHWFSLILVSFVLIFSRESSPLLYWLLCQAAFTAILLRSWERQHIFYVAEADRERQGRYELEQIKNDLLEATNKTVHLAELTERNRIARTLHDHLGHDLTGAKLAMEAIEHLEGEEAEEMMQQIKVRIDRSAVMLRDTVHDMTPVLRKGADSLAEISNEFSYIPTSFQQSGDVGKMPVQYWSLLEPCLKEALTNVAKHSDATEIMVQLDVNDSIVRLAIQDNGKEVSGTKEGSGLRHLKLRARAFGGSLSIARNPGFLVVCVLPIYRLEES